MMKIVLFLFLFSAPLLATTIKVNLYSASPTAAFAGMTAASPLAVIAEVTGDATSSSSPVTVYIPYIATPINEDFLGVNDASMAPRMSASNALVYFRNSLTLTNESSDTLFLYVASSISGSYKVIKAITTIASNSTLDVGAVVTLDNTLTESICRQAGNGFCTNFNADSYTSEVPLFYFLDKNVIARDFALPTTSSYNGVFYKLKISANVPSGSVTFSELRPGDSKLAASFEANNISQMGGDIYQTLIFNIVNPTSTSVGTLPGASANDHTNFIFKRISPAASGLIDIRDLENSRTYNLAIALMNKYQFVSNVSVSRSATPIKIEALLESQACFLLTAGFGEEHWVIDYFKGIRDHFLAKFSVGRWFIGTYYELAPKYAMQIYHSETLRLMIRTMAYLAYSVIHFYYIYLAVFSLGLLTLLRRRSRRI